MKIDISQAYTYGVSDEAALEFIEWRKSIKKPLTQRAFDRAMMVCLKCNMELGITADQALEVVIDQGWQGVVFEYIQKELNRRKSVETYQRANSRSDARDSALREYLQTVGQQGFDSEGVESITGPKAGSLGRRQH